MEKNRATNQFKWLLMLFSKNENTLPLKKRLVLDCQTVTISQIISVSQTFTDAAPFLQHN